jgi:hypothetical protein
MRTATPLPVPERRPPLPLQAQKSIIYCGTDMCQYLLDTGLLFWLNRDYLHPIGHALVVERDSRGSLELTLVDSSANPTLTFKPDQYAAGQRKWDKFSETVAKIAQLRKRLLGCVRQTKPDIRDIVIKQN